MNTIKQILRTLATTPLRSVFLKHPESIGESYLQHQRAALVFSASLIIAAAAAFLHALVPCLCETTARTRVESLNNRLQRRGSKVQGHDTESRD